MAIKFLQFSEIPNNLGIRSESSQNVRSELGNNPKSGDFAEYITQYSLLPSDGKLCKADFISKCVELSFLTFTLSRGLLET